MVNGRLPDRAMGRCRTGRQPRPQGGLVPVIGGLRAIDANFSQLQIIRLLGKYVAHSPRISAKSALPGQPAFQALLLGSPPMRRIEPRGLSGRGHAVSPADG